MSHPTRELRPGRIWSITNRVIAGQLLLTPLPVVYRLLAEFLRFAVEVTGVELYAYTVMSNHYHLVVKDHHGNLDEFMRIFQSYSSRLINQVHDRDGAIYARRYSAAPILDDESLIRMIVYTVVNPVSAVLTRRSEDWPGLSSAAELMGGEPARSVRFRRTEWHVDGRPEDRSPYREERPIPLGVPEFLHENGKPVSSEERAAFWKREIRRAEREAVAKWPPGSKPKTIQQILGQDVRKRVELKKTPRPRCHVSPSNRRLMVEFLEERRKFVADYREASESFRGGDRGVVFPPYSFPPRLPRAG